MFLFQYMSYEALRYKVFPYQSLRCDLWQRIQYKFKDLNQFAFSKRAKNCVLSQQKSNVSFHNSKGVKTMFYIGKIKRKSSQFS